MAYRTLAEKQGRLSHLQGEWRELYGKEPEGLSREDVSNLQEWNKEMTALGEEIAELKSLAAMSATVPAGGMDIVPNGDGSLAPKAAEDKPVNIRSTRDVLAKSAEYQAFQSGQRKTAVIEFGTDSLLGAAMAPGRGATTISLSTVSPQNMRLPRIEPYPLERRTVSDLLMHGTMDRPILEYYEETTFTNAAAETAEGTSKPEAAMAWTLRTSTASKIAVWIPATTEALADNAWLQSTLENRLQFMLQRRKEAQLMNGDGTGVNLLGITQRSGVQTQARGSDPEFDALLRASTLIQVNSFYDPDAIVMHPNNWQYMLLTRTADGIYILGNPGDPQAAGRLWGLEVRATTAQTAGTAVVGAYGTAAQEFERMGVTVTVSTEHSTYFIDNKVAILAELRDALAVYRPAAFATVTGLRS